MSIITERRKLSTTEKRAERDFDEAIYTRHRQTVPEYEVVPIQKSYLDLTTQATEPEIVVPTNGIFMPKNRENYAYEVTSDPLRASVETATEERVAPRHEEEDVRYRPELMPSEETMSMLRGGTAESNIFTRHSSDTYIGEEEATNRQLHISLNTGGKVAVIAYIAVILAMFITALVTASSVSAISTSNAALQEELATRQAQINTLESEADRLTSPATITAAAEGLGMYVPTEGNGLMYIELPTLKQERVYPKQTNWFNVICKFFTGLFGG
jgi:cell division protein FtsL